MLEKIKQWLEQHDLIASGDVILAACSGGPDSLVLVHSLHRLQGVYGFGLAVAHVDHMFRGRDSQADAAYVGAFCRQLGIACYQTAIDVPAYLARHSGCSAQAAARQLRYDYLHSIASQLGPAKIATGHQRDDQSETILMNLLRGAGSAGLRGIQPRNGSVIRPLLGLTRLEIDAYCRAEGLTPRQDCSNFSTDYLRNRIRMQLLPFLAEHYNPGIKEALCRTGALVGSQLEFIRQTVLTSWPRVVSWRLDALLINRSELAALHIAQQRELLRLAIEKKQGHTRGITFEHVEKMITMAFAGQVGSVLQLPGALIMRVDYAYLAFSFQQPVPVPSVQMRTLVIPGITNLTELCLTIVAELRTDVPEKLSPNSAVFAWSELEPPLYVRSRQDGDYFQPQGMKGTKKIKDLLIDAKVPRDKRAAIPVVCDQKGVLWVAGYRQAQRSSYGSKQFLQLSLCTGEKSDDDKGY